MVPTGIGGPAVLVAVSIGVTVPESCVGDVGGLAVRRDRDAQGGLPTGIGGPAVLVAVAIGVTVSELMLTT